MSLLDDARKLAGTSPFVFHPAMAGGDGDEDECFFCHEWRKHHEPDCPWLSLPKIVAALEAAEALRAELARAGQPARWGNLPSYILYPETVQALMEALDA